MDELYAANIPAHNFGGLFGKDLLGKRKIGKGKQSRQAFSKDE
jgi:hypothetical protein